MNGKCGISREQIQEFDTIHGASFRGELNRAQCRYKRLLCDEC